MKSTIDEIMVSLTLGAVLGFGWGIAITLMFN